MGGELLAEYLIEKLGENSQIVEIEGIRDTNVSQERSKGFNSRSGKDLNIIIRKNGDFSREKTYEVMKKILQEEAVIDGVFAHNDLSALGVIDALKEDTREITVVGFDGNLEAKNEIKKGNLTATIIQDPYSIGYIALENAIKLAKGQRVKKKIKLDVKLEDRDSLLNIN